MLQTIVHIFFQNVGVFKFKIKKKNIHKCRRGRKLHKCELSSCLLIGVLLTLKYSFSGSLCSSKYFSNYSKAKNPSNNLQSNYAR